MHGKGCKKQKKPQPDDQFSLLDTTEECGRQIGSKIDVSVLAHLGANIFRCWASTKLLQIIRDTQTYSADNVDEKLESFGDTFHLAATIRQKYKRRQNGWRRKNAISRFSQRN